MKKQITKLAAVLVASSMFLLGCDQDQKEIVEAEDPEVSQQNSIVSNLHSLIEIYDSIIEMYNSRLESEREYHQKSNNQLGAILFNLMDEDSVFVTTNCPDGRWWVSIMATNNGFILTKEAWPTNNLIKFDIGE